MRKSRLLGFIAAATLLLTATVALAADLPPGGTFTDDDGNTHEVNIEAIAAEGITKGCNPPTNDLYCPDDPVTRSQMAAFLVRAMGYTDDGGGDLFVDDDGSIFENDIDKLATAGVTKGCNPPDNTEYCPDDLVKRDQMASFLARALGLDPIQPPPPTSTTTTTTDPGSGWNPSTCTFDGIPMWGRVQVVDFFPDVTIEEVDFFPDLRVQLVDSFPSSCGEWQIVDSFPDFTVQVVDFFPDLRVEYVDFFPGPG